MIGADVVNGASPSAFNLPDNLAAKRDPRLIADDERHFAAIAAGLDAAIADLSERLALARSAPGGIGQEAMDRDAEVHRLTARLRTLRQYGLDLCLGRMVPSGPPDGDGDSESDGESDGDGDGDGDGELVYVGRLGLTDPSGRRLLVDWRSPAAEPFFGATHANPMGLAHRRRHRWTLGRISDYWDEVFAAHEFADHVAALDDQSAFIASLGASRSARMQDVLGTIQADQDAIIRAGSAGALVVDGGPGTGKTVVALHRAAYLLYSDPRLGRRRGGVLFIGPHQPYLDYVADVLPSLGEDGARTCTLLDLVPEAAAAGPEPDETVAALKSSARMAEAIEAAVRLYEEPPRSSMTIETEWADVPICPDDWDEAFRSVPPGTAHNDAREAILDALAANLVDGLAFGFDEDGYDDPAADQVRAALLSSGELRAALHRAWPLIDAADLVSDLWSVPAYLRRCAPWLSADEVHALQRAEPRAWTLADLPLLDAARHRLGDPGASRRRARRLAAARAERDRMAQVIDDAMTTDDDDFQAAVLMMLRGDDLRDALIDPAALPDADVDALAGPFAHIIVDEAQELTDAQWQMLLRRCPSRSFTVVGDRAQARHGFAESWQERLSRIGLDRVAIASLTINYRTPMEIMAEAEPVIRAALPDANVPTSVRSTGIPVRHGSVSELDAILSAWEAGHGDGEGVACVIGDATLAARLSRTVAARPRVRALTPELAKGLEFDLVVLVDPDSFGAGIEGAVDRYVAMTRATQELAILR